MVGCEFLSGCPFFHEKMDNMPAAVREMKWRYCKTAKMQCARYMIAQVLGKGEVPEDLFPNQIERARYLIKKYALASSDKVVQGVLGESAR